MGAYDRFRNADPMGARNYIKPGQHVFLVTGTEQGASKNPQKPGVEKSLVNFRIMKSDTMKAGEVTALVEMSTGQGYLGNVLAFTCGILGFDIAEVRPDPNRSKEDEAAIEAMFDAVWGTQQMCVGMLVACTAQKSDTSDYTNKIWAPVPAAQYPEYADGDFGHTVKQIQGKKAISEDWYFPQLGVQRSVSEVNANK